MKKVLLIAVLAVASLSASAQTEMGKIILGGQLEFSTDKSDADNAKATENFTILPTIGFFVADNIAIGTGIGYAFTKNPDIERKVGAFAIAPFGRYYKNLSSQFKFFGELAVPLAFGRVKDYDDDEIGSSTVVGVSLSPGFAFFPTKTIGIELAFNGINYTRTTVKDDDGDQIKGFGGESFSIGANFFSPRLGLQFYF